MSILDWVVVCSLSLAILLLLWGILYIFLFFRAKKLMKNLSKKRTKDKKKRRKMRKKREQINIKKVKNIKKAIMFLVLAIVSVAGAAYARYYQMTTLTSEDGNAIIQSYFLTDEIEKNLLTIQEGASAEKVKNNLQERSSLLASYGATDPSAGLAVDGIKVLKRYFRKVREYGVNVYSLRVEQLQEPETVTKYLDELKGIKEMQQKIFKQYGVNQSALTKKN